MEYTTQLGEKLCELYFIHGFSFAKIAKMDLMPPEKQIMVWLLKVPSFSSMFNCMRENVKDYRARSQLEDLLQLDPVATYKELQLDETLSPGEVKNLLPHIIKNNQQKFDNIVKLLEYDVPDKYTKKLDVRTQEIPSWDLKVLKQGFATLPHEQQQLLAETLNATTRFDMPLLQNGGDRLLDEAPVDQGVPTMSEVRDSDDRPF